MQQESAAASVICLAEARLVGVKKHRRHFSADGKRGEVSHCLLQTLHTHSSGLFHITLSQTKANPTQKG